jgi:hypothetical protein
MSFCMTSVYCRIPINDFCNAVFVTFIWHLAWLNDSCYEDVRGS